MLTIHLDTDLALPLYEQIYQYIKNEIKNGHLKYNTKLPSTRKLAEHLLISRNTVDMAYSQLLSEGYIESIPKKGYFICQVEDLSISCSNPSILQLAKKKEKKKYPYDFSPFAVDLSSFPFSTWRKLSKECMNDANSQLFLLGDRQGDLPFRNAIMQYLHENRGVNCTADQIIIGAGADYLLQLLAQILTNESVIAMENPTYKQAYMIFSGLNIQTVPISLDSNGMSVKDLEESNANICYVTPAHQYPLGIVMPIRRRMELLAWANKDENRYIIEDDHDSEFRYKGKPIPALQGMDHSDKVIYLGTFSRAIAPAIRIGYMVLPGTLRYRYQKHFSYYASTVSRIDQSLLTSFLQGGYFERHLNRMRKIYKSRHDTMIAELKRFGTEITIYNEYAGLHLLVEFRTPLSETSLLNTAQSVGIKLYSLKEHYITPPQDSDSIYLLFGYANISEEKIKAGIRKLYDILHESPSSTALDTSCKFKHD